MTTTPKARRKAMTTATLIGFSLTFAGAGLALLLGYLPPELQRLSGAAGSVDTGVVLLGVPLLALVLAILFEAARLTLRGPLEINPRRVGAPLAAWKPGQGEG